MSKNMVNKNKWKSLSYLTLIGGVLTLASCEEISSGDTTPSSSIYQSCTEKGVMINSDSQYQLIDFSGFQPIRLKTSKQCDLSGECSYSVLRLSGADYVSTGYDGIVVKDICESTAFEVGDATTPRSLCSNYQCGYYESIEYDWNRFSVLRIEGTEYVIEGVRQDYTYDSEYHDWGSVLDPSGNPIASNFQASRARYNFSIEKRD